MARLISTDIYILAAQNKIIPSVNKICSKAKKLVASLQLIESVFVDPSKQICIVIMLLCTKLNLSLAQVPNNALRFDGLNDYVNCDILVPALAATNQFTIEFWLKSDFSRNTVMPRVDLVAINPNATKENKFAIIMGETGSAQTGTLSIYEALGTQVYLTSIALIGDQNCHHVAYVRNGLMGEAFLDGVSIGTIPVGAPVEIDDRISIGQEWDKLFSSDFYNGEMDEVRFWTVARTQAQIFQNMNTTLSGSESGLLCYYNFNQGIADGDNTSLTQLIDKTANNLHGTLMGFDLNGSISNFTKANFAPEIDLGSDTILCDNNSIQLNGPNAQVYNWSTSASNSNILVNDAGMYWLEANNGACSASDTLKVQTLNSPISATHEGSFCKGTEQVLGAFDPEVSTYLWSNESTASDIQITEGGLYTVIRTNFCGSSSLTYIETGEDCACYVYAPNAFTPNMDHINPHFKIVYDCPLKDFNIKIFNRWGEILFESEDPDQGWDGNYNGKKAPTGIYSYKFEYINELTDEQKKMSGHIVLSD